MGSFEDKTRALSGAKVCNWRAEAVTQSQEFRKEYASRRTPELCVEAYMLFLDAGGRSGKHRHMWEELAFVVEGEGYDLHWDMMFDCKDQFIWEWDAEPKKFEWKQGDYIYVPPYTNHQSFATKESRIIVMSNRIIKDMGFDWHDQLENAPGF